MARTRPRKWRRNEGQAARDEAAAAKVAAARVRSGELVDPHDASELVLRGLGVTDIGLAALADLGHTWAAELRVQLAQATPRLARMFAQMPGPSSEDAGDEDLD